MRRTMAKAAPTAARLTPRWLKEIARQIDGVGDVEGALIGKVTAAKVKMLAKANRPAGCVSAASLNAPLPALGNDRAAFRVGG